VVVECLDDEVGDDASVVGVHSRAIGIEDPYDADVDVVGSVVIEEESFGAAFSFVVAGANSDGVDVSPVGFGLGMDVRFAVDFAGGGLEDFGSDAFGESEHVDGSHDGGFDGLDGVVLVMDGRGRAGEVVDFVDFERDGVYDVVADELEIGFGEEVCDIGFLAGEEVIEADEIVALCDEAVAEM